MNPVAIGTAKAFLVRHGFKPVALSGDQRLLKRPGTPQMYAGVMDDGMIRFMQDVPNGQVEDVADLPAKAVAICDTDRAHVQDEDCTVGADGTCSTCGVMHDLPCRICGGVGYHRPWCMDWIAEITAQAEEVTG